MSYIKSPLNYVGGKYKLLPQIIPLFPDDIDTFYDIFCGGANVAINVNANKIVANDLLSPVIDLFQILLINGKEEIFTTISEIIEVYNLSDSTKRTYSSYGCDSSEGLGKYNKEAYLSLRKDYNLSDNRLEKVFMFYVLACYSFSNQIRFNSKGEFNMPYGKRDFNKNMRENLALFLDRLKDIHITFTNQDFFQFYFDSFNKNDFVYFDPPYSETTATYNESGGWSKKSDETLFSFADRLNGMGIRFAMSNVWRTDRLKSWANKYNIHNLEYNYKNCNYQKKDKSGKEIEVLITNY
jgi:DNA adenine methylase Dam